MIIHMNNRMLEGPVSYVSSPCPLFHLGLKAATLQLRALCYSVARPCESALVADQRPREQFTQRVIWSTRAVGSSSWRAGSAHPGELSLSLSLSAWLWPGSCLPEGLLVSTKIWDYFGYQEQQDLGRIIADIVFRTIRLGPWNKTNVPWILKAWRGTCQVVSAAHIDAVIFLDL